MKRILGHVKDIDHVIWDWNGTLLNDVDLCIEILNEFLAERELSLIDRDMYRKNFGFPIKDFYQKMGLKLNASEFEEIAHKYHKIFMQRHTTLNLHENAYEVLSKIGLHVKKQSILSASEQNILKTLIEHHELEHFFHAVYGLNNFKAESKIQRGKELIQISDIPKEKTLLIGDTDHDLEVGNALGINVLLVGYGHQCPTILKVRHHNVI